MTGETIEEELQPTIDEANRLISNFECPVHGPGQYGRVTPRAQVNSNLQSGKVEFSVETCCPEGEKVAEALVTDLLEEDIDVEVTIRG